MKVMKKGFNYSQDGPGNRLIYHLQGCNMRCPWCSNPEGMDPRGCMLVKDQELPEGVCPKGAVRDGTLNRALCRECRERECTTIHRNQSISFSYQQRDVSGLISEAVHSRTLFFDGGGVTVTGGEATLQFEELKDLLFGLKREGIHTALETNGTHKRLLELLPALDVLIIDLKHIDDGIHKAYTGLSNGEILKNIREASRQAKELWVRTPLIHGFNDDPRWIPEFLRFYDTCSSERMKLELLLYHEYGREKWGQCGKEYTFSDGFVDEALREDFEKAYKEHGLTVVRT